MSSGGSGSGRKYNEATGRMPDPPRYWDEPVQASRTGEVVAHDIDEEEEELEEDQEEELEEEEEEEVEDEGVVWKFGQPQPQPLRYQVVTANGGIEDKYLRSNVDFNSRDSVNKANKQRRLQQYRAKQRHGVGGLLRASTRGREYTQAHDDYITQQHHAYAAAHNNERIPYTILTDLFNSRFPGQNRTKNSISSHVEQRLGLRGMRGQYDGAEDE